MSRPVYIAGSGTYLPGEPIPFDNIESVLGELTESPQKIQNWISRMKPVMAELLDIKFLHYAIDPVTREFSDDNISMSVKAAQIALDHAGFDADQIDLICYGSAHQDQMPTASVRIQEDLGIETCQEFSIHANCTSAYKALYLAHELIKNGSSNNALVISSSMSSSELRSEYYNQKLLDKESLFLRWFLSDGAGAIFLTADRNLAKNYELEYTFVESIGGKKPSLMFNYRPAYWMNPKDEYEKGYHHLRQNFRNALSSDIFQEPDGSIFFKGFKRMLSKHPVAADAIRLFQINMPTKHIVDSITDEFKELGISGDAFYTKLDELGYNGPPMALVCLDKIIREESLNQGEYIASFVTEVSKFMQAGYFVRRI
ncbi:MAG: 3-oxoacyl-ACP synthase III family protein [Calditrichaceae bacterium]